MTITEPWSWSFRAYPGIWLSVLFLLVPYLIVMIRRTGPNPDRGRRIGFFVAGVAIYWIATDWPLGTLGSSYLASVHMVQYLLYSLGAAPLILLGIPEWMARRILGRLRLYRAVRLMSRPLAAGLVFNAVLVVTHAPLTVDTLRSSQFGSFGLDLMWLLAGLLFWMPVISPMPELRPVSYGARMVYLFLAGQVIPMIPGGFLTFSDFPLYSTYELAPRIGGFSASHDQALAGVLMKLGGMPVVWGTMLALMIKWARSEGHMADTRPRSKSKAEPAT
ncbi:MAG: cytochrome c oxidase assembly protein [Acidimicrobiales bacterium]|nr:cytochrome c oxidase assembly protein [Acidimicrobiales bacterium]